jgi:hypothetical protein
MRRRKKILIEIVRMELVGEVAKHVADLRKLLCVHRKADSLILTRQLMAS